MVRDKGKPKSAKSGKRGKAMSGNASIETGHFAELASAVVQQLPRDIDATTAQGWIENRSELQRALRVALLPNTQNVGPTYPVTVNYDLSLAGMIKAGRYDWVNSDITENHFPENHFPVKGEGSKDIALELIHFNMAILSKDALSELDERGLRPATIEELLAFGTKYPELQRQFPVLALGSIWRQLGDRHVPCLWSGSLERFLSLDWFEGRWDDYFRFLAVRK